MFDLEYLKKRLADYSTTDLLRHIFLETENFTPEAMKIFKDEVERREGEIEGLISKEATRTGVIEYVVKQTIFHETREENQITGNTYLTSKGLFFIPESIFKTSAYRTFLSIGVMELRLLGLVIDEDVLSLTIKESNKKLPLSMLTSIMPYSFCILIHEIKNVTYSNNGRIQTENYDDEQETLSVARSDLPTILSWLNLHNAPYSKNISLLSKLFG